MLENHWVQIQSGKRNYKLVGMSKDNFPTIPDPPHALAKIPASMLSGLISRTAFAISSEESRYTLNGGLLVLKPEMAAMVATDGHRLALAETDHKFSGLNTEARVLVPKKALSEIQRLRPGPEKMTPVEFARDDSYLFFQVGPRRLVSRILTGQFPNFEAVLPRENKKNSRNRARRIQRRLRRVSQLADQRSRAVKIRRLERRLEISAQSPEYGEADRITRQRLQRRTDHHRFQRAVHARFSGVAADGPDSVSSSKTNNPPGNCVPWATKHFAIVT